MRLDAPTITCAMLARRLEVDVRTAQRWCATGRLSIRVTPTGHYRVEVDADGMPVLVKPRPSFANKTKRRGKAS